jgi:hypothetical protein
MRTSIVAVGVALLLVVAMHVGTPAQDTSMPSFIAVGTCIRMDGQGFKVTGIDHTWIRIDSPVAPKGAATWRNIAMESHIYVVPCAK